MKLLLSIILTVLSISTHCAVLRPPHHSHPMIPIPIDTTASPLPATHDDLSPDIAPLHRRDKMPEKYEVGVTYFYWQIPKGSTSFVPTSGWKDHDLYWNDTYQRYPTSINPKTGLPRHIRGMCFLGYPHKSYDLTNYECCERADMTTACRAYWMPPDPPKPIDPKATGAGLAAMLEIISKNHDLPFWCGANPCKKEKEKGMVKETKADSSN